MKPTTSTIKGWNNTPEDINEYEGFVYEIKHNKSDKYYIGKKQFWSHRKLKPLKGTKRRRKVVKESDWKNYWGSSKRFLEFIEQEGKENFTRNIIKLCKTKWDLSYDELIAQLERDVLFDDNSYNGIINVRLNKRKKHV